jgi:hypothetical protein
MAADTPRLAIARSLGLLQAGTGRGMATRAPQGRLNHRDSRNHPWQELVDSQAVAAQVLPPVTICCSEMSHFESSKFISINFVGL